MKTTWVRPDTLPAADGERLLGKPIEREYRFEDLLRRPGVTFDTLTDVAAIAGIAPAVSRETLHAELGQGLADAVIEQVEISVKYAGYIGKQVDDVARAAHFENLRLPDDFDYGHVTALSHEVRQKLARHRPETLGQASRMSGMTPAAMSLLLIHLKKRRFEGFAANDRATTDAAA
jgi:tRNA uridine 5-carboxymethylaminomethyl modification enzyme